MLQAVAKHVRQLAHEWPVLGQVKQQVPAGLQAHLALAWALALAAMLALAWLLALEEEMMVAAPRCPPRGPETAPAAVGLQRQQAGEWLPPAMEEAVEWNRRPSQCWPMLVPGLPAPQD